MKKRIIVFLAILIMLSAVPARAGEYTRQMKHDLGRGFKNILTCWMEIPVTVQEYHEAAGRPVIRHFAGLIDGTFQTLVRASSGLLDLVAAFIPGQQEGLPVDPETLF